MNNKKILFGGLILTFLFTQFNYNSVKLIKNDSRVKIVNFINDINPIDKIKEKCVDGDKGDSLDDIWNSSLITSLCIEDYNSSLDRVSEFENLENLSLDDVDCSFDVLSRLSQLKSLDLEFCDLADISFLYDLNNLEYLSIFWCYNFEFIDLKSFISLKSISINANREDEVLSLFGIDGIEYAINNGIEIKVNGIGIEEYFGDCKKLILLDMKLENLDFLKYFKNLKNLEIVNYSDESYVNNIDAIKYLEKLESLELNKVNCELNAVGECKNLREMELYWCNTYDVSFLSSLNNLEILTIEGCDNISLLNLKEMSSIRKITLINKGLYDVMAYITFDDIVYAKDNEIELNVRDFFDNSFDIQVAKDIDVRLNTMVNSLEINRDDNNNLNEVLACILNNTTYDDGIYYGLSSSYLYNIKQLELALDDDPKSICCNYARLFKAISNRIGLESYYITSSDHAWNLVKIDNSYYYVDATYLDYEINEYYNVDEANYNQIMLALENVDLEWDKINPRLISNYDDSSTHYALNYPSYVNNSKTNIKIRKK